MIFVEQEKFVACGKATVRKDRNGWYTVIIGKSKIAFNLKRIAKFQNHEITSGCDVIVVGGVHEGRLYGWDIKVSGKVSIPRYTLIRGTYEGTVRGRTAITSTKKQWYACGSSFHEYKTLKKGEPCTYVCQKYYKSNCLVDGGCIRKSPAACKRCGSLKRELTHSEIVAAC